MKLADFYYYLPQNLIAQKPVKPRDHSRLLVFNRKNKQIRYKHFYDIADYLHAGDVLVLNNSKVMPARLIGKKIPSRGKIEVFLLRKTSPLLLPLTLAPIVASGKGEIKRGRGEVWQCLIGGKKRKNNQEIQFKLGLKAIILKNNKDGTWLVKFNKKGRKFKKIVDKIGRVPLPPYIKRTRDSTASLQNDKINYQTVYANDKKIGSVAAPTAGFHFTPKLLKRIKAKGIKILYLTLHVGLGTFAPVKVNDVTKHQMHSEWVEVSKETLENIIKAKQEGRRIIAIGTTSVRTLEGMFKNKGELTSFKKVKSLKNFSGWINIFIYPGYKFKVVDAMITNFHLPKSTLLMLVSAFAGRKNILNAYEQSIKKKYRFYSYGDAMFIY